MEDFAWFSRRDGMSWVLKGGYILGKWRVILGESVVGFEYRDGDERSCLGEIEDVDLNRGRGMCKD